MNKRAFQRVYNYESRQSFVEKCLVKSPDRLPVYVYAAQPYEDKIRLTTNKYIVRKDMSVGQFQWYIRENSCDKSVALGLLLFTDKGEIPMLAQSMEDAYNKYVDVDGFFYIQIAVESVFG